MNARASDASHAEWLDIVANEPQAESRKGRSKKGPDKIGHDGESAYHRDHAHRQQSNP